MYNKICSICGKMFVSKYSHTKMCSAECRKEAEHLTRTRWKEKKNITSKAKTVKLSKESAKAREIGLSYGEYTAIKRAGELYIRGRLWVYDPFLDVVSVTKNHSE